MEIKNLLFEASINKHLGIANFEMKNYSSAIEFFLKSFELKKENKCTQVEIFEILQLIGDAEYNLDSFNHARESFNCCKTILESNPKSFGEFEKFKILKKIGICLKNEEKIEDAINILT